MVLKHKALPSGESAQPGVVTGETSNFRLSIKMRGGGLPPSLPG